MELQFHTAGIKCLKTVKWDVQTQEQTQEVKLPDGLPDMGRVLGAWGQPILRGKQWQPEELGVSCGAMVWVLYAPEEGGLPRMVESWLPMELSWQIPAAKQDGKLLANCLLRSVDARMTAPRRLMVRANMSVQMRAYTPDQVEICQPDDLPEDIQLLKKNYPVTLPLEAGEKSFQLDEELELPASCPKPQSFLQFSVQPVILDKKVMSGRVVFRGNANVHTVYRTQEDGLHSWDFEVPFSQYTDLDGDYSEQAQVCILPQLTGLETETDEAGRIRMKAGITCQYVACDTVDVAIVEDAFSPIRKVEPKVQGLNLPNIQMVHSQNVLLGHTMPVQAMAVVDGSMLVDQVRRQNLPEQVHLEIPAMGQMLYYDMDGQLQSTTARWEEGLSMEPAEGTMETVICPVGVCTAQPAENGMGIEKEVLLETMIFDNRQLPMVTGLEVGQPMPKDPNRPSVILRRTDAQGLWKIAKQAGSSVEAICKANGLDGEPEEGRMLLIPVE